MVPSPSKTLQLQPIQPVWMLPKIRARRAGRTGASCKSVAAIQNLRLSKTGPKSLAKARCRTSPPVWAHMRREYPFPSSSSQVCRSPGLLCRYQQSGRDAPLPPTYSSYAVASAFTVPVVTIARESPRPGAHDQKSSTYCSHGSHGRVARSYRLQPIQPAPALT